MCQIITAIYTNDIVGKLSEHKQNIADTLYVKGGDAFSAGIHRAHGNDLIVANSATELVDNVIAKCIETYTDSAIVVFFSRQRPEMEHAQVPLPPYYNEEEATYNYVHGTISNDTELAKEINKTITVDTEISRFYKTNSFVDGTVKGLYSMTSVTETGVVLINKGMGLWEYRNVFGAEYVYTVTDHVLVNNHKKHGRYITGATVPFCTNLPIYNNEQSKVYHVLYSGGMDITLSLFYTLAITPPQHGDSILLYYMAYGTNAEMAELDAHNKASSMLKKKYPHIHIDTIVVTEMTPVLEAMMNMYGRQSSLVTKTAEGSIEETETNLSYVPYRNTLFALCIGNYIDAGIDTQKYDASAIHDIMFGLNLSEGMVFGDNNSAWSTSMEKVVSTGGKYYKHCNIVAPFINDTKTTMLNKAAAILGTDFEDILDISFSCYYPTNDNQPCGKCGSCILREKAISKLSK